MLRHPVGRCRLLIITTGVLVLLYALGVFGYVLGSPDIGLRCAFAPVINHVDNSFAITYGGKAAPQVGDTITQLGSHRVETWPELLRAQVNLRREAVQADYRSTDDFVTAAASTRETASTCVRVDGELLVRVQLRRQSDGSLVTVWRRVGSLPLVTLIPSLLWFFLKAGLFAVGALVLWKRPEDRSARQFFLLCIATFGAYMGGYHWSRIITQPLLLGVFSVCSVLVPAVSLHFYLVFPRPKGFLERQPRRTLLTVYGPPAIFLLLLVSDYVRVRVLLHGDLPPAEMAAALKPLLSEMLHEILLYFAVAALWYVASFICLVHSYRTARDATERNQVKWILYGILASLVPISYTLYLAFFERNDFGGGAGTWPMFAASVCVTLAFTISITRYRLMQLDQILSAGMVYFLISLLAGMVYSAVVFVFALVFSWRIAVLLTQAVGVGTAALVLMLVLDWLRSRVKRALDRRFFREKHQLDRTLRRLSQAIEQLIDPPVLARRLLQASAELLGVTRGSIYLREGDPPLYRLVDSLGEAPPLIQLSSGCPLIEVLQTNGTLVHRPRSAVLPDPAQRQLQHVGGAVAQALLHEGRLLALLVLGPRDLGEYTAEDLNMLAAFAQFTALALEVAQGHRTIETLNRDLQGKVEKISEQQRRILALQSQLRHRSEDRSQESGVRSQESGVNSQGTGDECVAGLASLTPDSCLLTPVKGIIGSSPLIRHLLKEVRQVAASPSVVLLRGESGTGKELLAQALHDDSPRAGKPFVKVHCAALSPGLLESELFGHVKGAFTGAHRDKMGRFEMANGGTLFLDEIGDINLEVQTKLLRVLEEMTFERVGSSEPVRVDVRVLAATHQNLEQLITVGRFREDLYYRLNVISVTVPSLRERREDIPELATHFLALYAQRNAKPIAHIDDDALSMLKAYSWPGNIRQLENVIQRVVVVAEGSVIGVQDLPPELLRAVEDMDLLPPPNGSNGAEGDLVGLQGLRVERAERDRRERERLVRALAAAKGNKAEAARALGLHRSTLVSRLRKHGLQ